MTLIEMLAAMMVSMMIIGAAFATFWTGTQAWETGRRRTEMLRLLDGAADFVERQIRAMHSPFLTDNPAFYAIDDADEAGAYDGIIFLSSGNLRHPRQLAYSDLCEMEIFIDVGQPLDDLGAATTDPTADPAAAAAATPAEGAMPPGDPAAAAQAVSARTNGGLFVRIDPTPDDDVESGGYLISLGEQITSFDCRYYDGFEWVEEWFYDYEVPEAIEFTLTVTDPEGRENPLSLTRLVPVPLAKVINEAGTSSFGMETGTGMETQPTEGGQGQSSSEGSRGAGGSGGSSGRSSGGTSSGGGSSGGGGGGSSRGGGDGQRGGGR